MIKDLSFKGTMPKAASPEDMAALETKLGVKLPPSFHEFCFRWNGGFPSTQNRSYLVPSSCVEFYKGYRFGKKTKGVYIMVDTFLGTSQELKACDLVKHYHLCGGAPWGFIPIATNIMGGMAVLRTSSPMEKVYYVDPDTYEMPEGIEWGSIPGNPDARLSLMPIAENLESFYNALEPDQDLD